MKKYALCALVMFGFSGAAHAELVKTDFFTNDYIGDGHDRWRSGSYTSYLGFQLPDQEEASVDLRLRSEIISPWGSSKQDPETDRPYVGLLGLGLFYNGSASGMDLNLGGELVMVGDQTGISDFQDNFHDTFGFDGYSSEADGGIVLDDSVDWMLSAETAVPLSFGENALLRPYIGGQIGYESFARTGIDLTIGNSAGAGQFVRDPVSGFIQPSSTDRRTSLGGLNFYAGADITYVADSEFMPDYGYAQAEDVRTRVRAGLRQSFGPVSVFYGATHLSEEFTTQVESQTVGTISIDILSF
jgi:hypothetical protein